MSIQKSIAVFALASLALCLKSQDLSLPSLQILEKSLTTFTELERNAQLKSYDRTKSRDWADLLPSLGVAYTPTGEPRPAASWSPLQILDRKEQNRKRKLDRESICLQYEILLTDRLYRLRQLYHDYQIDLKHIRSRREMIAIDEQLFAITERKYEENIIKPSEYLQAKKQILATRSAIEILEQELLKKRNQILYEAKWN